MRRLLRIRSLWNQRGQILVFAMLALVFLWVVGGTFAYDVAHLFSDRAELQAALDAAALAGAGKLGFTDAQFPVARDYAVSFAQKSLNRSGTVMLNRNDANDPSAPNSVLLGFWNPSNPQGVGAGLRFEPSLDANGSTGKPTNAVLCKYQRSVRPSFLSLWGLLGMDVAAVAIATANPPATVPPDACVFPIGVGDCPFQRDEGTQNALGCGATITFITSSGNPGDEGAGCLAPPCTNTAAWVSVVPGQDPNVPNVQAQINAAKGGGCGSALQTNDNIDVNNGMAQPIMNTLEAAFKEMWLESGTQTVTDSEGNTTYSGKGWKVYIPVIDTDCPSGAIAGSKKIVGWTTMVITQVINKGKCAVENTWHRPNNPWDPIGKGGTGENCLGTSAPSNSGSLRAVFGYYSCELIKTNPNPLPGPITALATKLRLVR